MSNIVSNKRKETKQASTTSDQETLKEQPEDLSPSAEALVDGLTAQSPETKATVQPVTNSTWSWPPAPRSRRKARPFSNALRVLAIILALLLTLGGLALVIFGTTVQYRQGLHTQATIEVRTTRQAQATASSYAQATANVINTVQAGIDATATSQTNEIASATAVVVNATATVSTLEDFYKQMTGGTATFDNPLSDDTGKGLWDEGSNGANTGCNFEDGKYRASEGRQNYFQPCIAQDTRFGNFAYQVTVTVTKGGQGLAGLLFRINSTNKGFYFFHISPNGNYGLDIYKENGDITTLSQGTSSAITPGLNQPNQLAVIVKSNQLLLYVNGQYVATVLDSKLSSGKIGVGVANSNTPVEAEFSDSQVWKLSNTP